MEPMKWKLDVKRSLPEIAAILDGDNRTVCSWDERENRSEPPNRERLELIVKCVNMHHGMMVACEETLQLANTLILNLSRSESAHYEQLKFVIIESCNRLCNLVPRLESALAENGSGYCFQSVGD